MEPRTNRFWRSFFFGPLTRHPYSHCNSRSYQKHELFVTGIGIHYAPSVITNPACQPTASALIIGQRLIPHIVLRAADARPYEIQDLCPADTRFKILLFVGDLAGAQQAQRVSQLAADMGRAEGFLNKFGRRRQNKEGEWDVFDILTICAGKKESVNHLDVPKLFRPHWSKYVMFFLSFP